jgi:exonuclease SbcC
MITSVKLDNFLSHRDTELTFDNGVTVFIGGNGAGKSSIIDAMTFALFGKTRRGTNEETIRVGENQAATQIYFEVNGKKYQAIKKILKNNSPHQLLDSNSSPIAIGTEKVSEEVKKIIGLDYDTLGIASIVPQGQLTEIIQSDNGIKLRSLIDKVIGTGKYSAAEKGLGEGIAAFREYLTEKYNKTDKDVENVQMEINHADKIISESKPQKEKLEKMAESLKEKIKKIQEKKEELSVNHEKIIHLKDKEDSVWKAIKQEISSLVAGNEEHSKIIQKCEESFGVIKAKSKTEDMLNSKNHKKKDIDQKISECVGRLLKYNDRKNVAGKIEFSDGECPICHTKDVTVDPEYQIEHIEQELKKIESEKTSLAKESSNMQDQIDDITKKIKEIEYAENTIKNSPIKNSKHLEDWKNDLKLNQNKNNELEKIIESSDLSSKLVEFMPNLSQTFLDIEKLQKEIKDFKHEEYDKVERELQTVNSENQVILMRIGQETEKINSADVSIKKNIPILEEIKLAKKYVENLEKIRTSVFSTKSETIIGARNFAVESISRNASQYLEQLKTEIKYLELFQDGNSIKIQCHTNNSQRPVKNLSGGEQVCVALAVRLGMSDLMIKSSLKIMVLDEPTAYLDDAHCEYFVDAIQQLTNFMNEKQNFQFIIITHDEDIWKSAKVGTIYKFTLTSDGTEVSRL